MGVAEGDTPNHSGGRMKIQHTTPMLKTNLFCAFNVIFGKINAITSKKA